MLFECLGNKWKYLEGFEAELSSDVDEKHLHTLGYSYKTLTMMLFENIHRKRFYARIVAQTIALPTDVDDYRLHRLGKSYKRLSMMALENIHKKDILAKFVVQAIALPSDVEDYHPHKCGSSYGMLYMMSFENIHKKGIYAKFVAQAIVLPSNVEDYHRHERGLSNERLFVMSFQKIKIHEVFSSLENVAQDMILWNDVDDQIIHIYVAQVPKPYHDVVRKHPRRILYKIISYIYHVFDKLQRRSLCDCFSVLLE